MLANSHSVLIELNVDCAADWVEHFKGINYFAMHKLRALIGSDADLLSICNAARNPTGLQVINAHCTDVGLAAIGEHCPALESLHVLNSDLEDDIVRFDAGIASTAQGCSKLKHLYFESVHLTRVGMTAVGTHCTQLQSLSLKDCGFGGAGLRKLAKLSLLPCAA